MPSEQTAEQLEIRRRGRQRLIGAIALALLAVVFVPMLLDPEPRRERVEPLLTIPPREGVAPLPPAPAPAPSVAAPAVTGTAAKEQSAAPSPVATPADAAAAAAPAPAPAAKRADAATAAAPVPARKATALSSAPALEGFAVQIGAFKDEDRLQRSREKLVAAGLPHYLERQSDLTRLRAGPFPTREAAEKALASLKRGGIEGRVVSLP